MPSDGNEQVIKRPAEMNVSSTANLVENGGSSGGHGQGQPPAPKVYDPYKHRKLTYPTTDFETLIHLLKGSLGSGILAMPMAFLNAGLLFGLVGTVLVGMIATYCVNILVNCAHQLCQRRKLPSLGFDDVAQVAFLEGPQAVRRYAPLARFAVNLFLFVDLWGTCCVYIVFVGSNLKQVFDLYLGDGGAGVDLRVYMVCLVPPLLLVNMIRNLKYLAPLSMLANVCMGTALGVTLYYVVQDLPYPDARPAIAPLDRLPLFFGTAIFALEGIGVVMPLENNMATPENFLGCPGVLNVGMSIVVGLYCVVGFLGYLHYGPDTQAAISLNLPDTLLAQSVKVMIAVAMFFTYALQFYVPINIVLPAVRRAFPRRQDLAEYSMRAALVLLSVVVAILVPNLGPFISLVGAVCLSSLGLIFPSVVELVVFWDVPGGLGRGHWVVWKNALVIGFGLLGFFTGTYTSVLDMIDAYGGGPPDDALPVPVA